MNIRNRISILKMVLGGYVSSFKGNDKPETGPIDFVVTWVDGNDPEWQREKENYAYDLDGNGSCRYRDWESFRYWFRAVEKFAPWVRYVWLVTWGHTPSWLKSDCSKLKIIRHSDFIPAKYLPTYNSNTIELNLFRIHGLSECFVYFNDDILLSRPVMPNEFFENGKPKHSAIAVPYINRDNEMPYHLFFNTYGVANKENKISRCIERCPSKWFSHLYGKSAIMQNVRAWKDDGFSGIYFTHVGVPFCRSSMKLTWKKYENECDRTCSYRFRNIHQITHQIFSIEDILNGNFEPSICDWGSLVEIDNYSGIADVYKTGQTKMICLFDRDNMSNEEIQVINKKLVLVLEQFLADNSDFELQ